MENATINEKKIILDQNLASRWRRLIGAIIDLIVLIIIMSIILGFFGEFPEVSETNTLSEVLQNGETASLWAQVTYYGSYFLIIGLFAFRSQTPGKFFTKTYIVREDGTPYGFFQTILREVLIIASLFFIIPYIIAGLWCIFDEKAQCLWDKVFFFVPKIGRSYVINKKATSPVSTIQIIDQQKTHAIAIEQSPLHRRSQIAEDLREIDLLLEQGVINEKEHSERRHERIHGKS